MTSSAPGTVKIQLKEEKHTLLITLYAKALDSRLKESILHDDRANAILKAIEYDFEKLNSFGDGNIMVVRAKQLDEWIKEFLVSRENAVVLNLGCGLDTRISRINPPQGVLWFDVDFPEVIELRKKFYSDLESYRMIAASVTDPAWWEAIPKDRPAMIVAEGLLEYLGVDDVEALLKRITDRLTHGQVVFDVMNSFAINSGKSRLKRTTGAEHKWAVDHDEEVDRLNRKLTRIYGVSIFKARAIKLLAPKYRMIYSVLSLIPGFKNMIRLLRYEF